MQFFDRGKISTRKFTDEGYLRVKAKAGRPGIQNYSRLDFESGAIPKSLDGKNEFRILRPESEVFAKDAIESFKLKPVTVEHPIDLVNAQNIKQYQTGVIQDMYQADNDLETELLVQDSDAIRTVEAGKEQVSLGYEANIEWVSGIDAKYGAYDAKQTNIKGNHLAIVDRARAGSAYRLFDHAAKELDNMSENVKVNDALTAENSKLKVAVSDAEAEITSLKSKVSDAETKLAELATELETTKKQIVSDAEISERVEKGIKERVAVVDSARAVMGDKLEVDGKSTVEIQLAVIDHLTGGASKPDAENAELVASVYDAVCNIAKNKTEAVKQAVSDSTKSVKVSDSDASRQKMIARRNGKKEAK